MSARMCSKYGNKWVGGVFLPVKIAAGLPPNKGAIKTLNKGSNNGGNKDLSIRT